MTTKTSKKGADSPSTPVSPTREVIQMAYQAHTLSQILYGHLSQTQAWSGSHLQGGYGIPQMPRVSPLTWAGPFLGRYR